MHWLGIAAVAQLVMFGGFIAFFFSSEQQRQGELIDMQGELHRLRAENERHSKRLIHANKRMLKYEAEIRAELTTHGDEDGFDAEDPDADVGFEALDVAEGKHADNDNDDDEEEREEDGDLSETQDHGSVAPSAHIQPAASKAGSSSNGSSQVHEHHGHPQRASMPSAADAEKAAAAMPAMLRGKCLHHESDWWTYEICFGRSVRQYHQAKQGETDENDSFSLGRFVAPSSTASHGHMLQRYRGGDECAVGSGTKRSTEVHLRCTTEARALTLESITEPHTCHYLFRVSVPKQHCKVEDAEYVVADDDSAGGGGGVGSTNSKGDGVGGTAGEHESSASSSPVAAAAATVGGTLAAKPLGPAMRVEELEALASAGDVSIVQKHDAVVHAIKHAWRGYETRAFGADEVRPISGSKNDWIGLGLTILDSLDVLWMAGLRDEYERAAAWVRSSLNFDARRMKVSFFETTIRCLGGLVTAYELSGDRVMLEKATQLGERLAKAFSSPSGMPYTSISLVDGSHTVPSWLQGSVLLAEVGTVQMEFAALAEHAGRPELRAKSDHVFDLLDTEGPKVDPSTGGRLWPIHIRPDSGKTTGATISWGAMGDSFYEYLLKYWLLTGKKHEQYKRMYLEATRAMIAKLVYEEGGLTYIAESKNNRIDRKMDHLVCFVPGMLALGAQHLPEVKEEHMALAEKLAHTCYEMYHQQKTGLSPEFVRFANGAMTVGAGHNLLRPEAAESMFYLWRFTKNPKYREWGWKMFLAFEKYCKVESGGYAGLRNVNIDHGKSPRDDKMETFWLAETLKYFLLLFSDDDLLNLETHVLNTEAHPLKVMER